MIQDFGMLKVMAGAGLSVLLGGMAILGYTFKKMLDLNFSSLKHGEPEGRKARTSKDDPNLKQLVTLCTDAATKAEEAKTKAEDLGETVDQIATQVGSIDKRLTNIEKNGCRKFPEHLAQPT